MKGWWLVALIPAAVSAFAATPAAATGYDISLAGLVDPQNKDPSARADKDSFDLIVMDLGLSLQPRFSGPASTVGSLGFDVGFNLVRTDLTADSRAAWAKAVPDPLSTLEISQVHVRKGLPFSFELGCAVSKLHDSRLWGVAFEVKTAFVEGYTYVPDIGARGHISTVIGSRDLAMLGLGGDLLISKSFGIAGMFQFTPYTGYSYTFVYATSHVIGRFYESDTAPVPHTLSDSLLSEHRGIVGAALRFSAAELAFEMVRNDTYTTTGFRVSAIF